MIVGYIIKSEDVGGTCGCIQTYSTSSYDVVVIRHRNNTLKSTPFQAVFAEKSLKRDPKKNKLRDLQLIVNEEPIDIPIRIDPTNARVQFQKVLPITPRNTFASPAPSQTPLISQTTTVRSDQLRERSAFRMLSKERRSRDSRTSRLPRTFGSLHGSSAVNAVKTRA